MQCPICLPAHVSGVFHRVPLSCNPRCSLAAAYARVVGHLPPPPDGAPLYVHVGNEFNACNEWRCAAPPRGASASSLQNMSGTFMAREVAAFSRDVAVALSPLRRDGGGASDWAPGQLQLAHGPQEARRCASAGYAGTAPTTRAPVMHPAGRITKKKSRHF